MMKIGKPVAGKEFLLSSVQFTSLKSIVFKNVKNVYEGNEKITLEYEHSTKIEVSSRDWIGIFPHGWSTLQQYITFEWVSQSFSAGNAEQNKENADLVRRAIIFAPKYHMSSINPNAFYQFVYISKQIEVLGVSSYFRFDTTNMNNRTFELECLVPVSSKLRSTSVSDFGILLGNSMQSSTSIDTHTLQTSSIHSLQNLDGDGKNWTKPPISLNGADAKKSTIFPRKSNLTGDSLDPYLSHSEPVFPMAFQMSHCKKCVHFKRGGEFLRSQQVLQSKVGPRSEGTPELCNQRRTNPHEIPDNKLKIVMERNKVLEERSQEMKKEMERLQAESKKLKTSFYNTNKEKVAYERFVKDFIKSLEKDSIVRVVNGNTEILVKKVNYVGMEEHPRGKKTSKRERELKAVIGLQEITIRNLINSLQEKAKSVKELNQTVKLAQAFSSARGDTRDYGSDADETLDEVSNSDATSEYEFSLTKPKPPEETTVEDTDAVLEDIRRTTEMELKDIGINRSLGKSTSRDSELDLPNLSVRSYHNQSEGTRPKKPRLFDNLEDCWPFAENTPKTVYRRVIDSSSELENRKEGSEDVVDAVSSASEISEEVKEEPIQPEMKSSLEEPAINASTENNATQEDSANYEDYYDACEGGENSLETSSPEIPDTAMAVVQEEWDEINKEKNNFLVTAIIPHEMNLKPISTRPASPLKQSPDENSKITVKQEGEASTEKKPTNSSKGKKFTCELSIDFSPKRNNENITSEGTVQPACGGGPENSHREIEMAQYQICKQMVSESENQTEKPVVTFNKTNKCLEIKITQVDQKENNVIAKRKVVHQKMVVKFGQNSQVATPGAAKPSKFEFNVALTGMKDGAKEFKEEMVESSGDVKPSEDENVDAEASPRTVWNDANDDAAADDELLSPEASPREKISLEKVETESVERQSVRSEDSKEDSLEISAGGASIKTNEDSFRYEKNLEFLQQKTNDRMSGDDESAARDKPSAILIQNGQTKLALIRFEKATRTTGTTIRRFSRRRSLLGSSRRRRRPKEERKSVHGVTQLMAILLRNQILLTERN